MIKNYIKLVFLSLLAFSLLSTEILHATRFSKEEEFATKLKVLELEIRDLCEKNTYMHKRINEIFFTLYQLDERVNALEDRMENLQMTETFLSCVLELDQNACHVRKRGKSLPMYKGAYHGRNNASYSRLSHNSKLLCDDTCNDKTT